MQLHNLEEEILLVTMQEEGEDEEGEEPTNDGGDEGGEEPSGDGEDSGEGGDEGDETTAE